MRSLALALVACVVLRMLPDRLLAPVGLTLIAAGFAVSELTPGSGGKPIATPTFEI